MKKHLSILLLIAIPLLFNSCKKHETITNPEPIVPYDAGKTISTIVAGKVTDQTGAALNGVEIAIGSSTTITDVGGNFIIPKATLGEKVGFIKATKTGYFAGSRTIIAQEKVINNIVIQLVKKTISGSFSNASGGTITIATGGSIVFGANSITLKNGSAYTGNVNVYAYFLDPTSINCFKEMPGDLRGINTSNNEQVLTSYGMMAVELQGSNGEALQIATGKTATLSFPIATSIKVNAPATIPLWFFDETKGMWVEQGTATKTGNNYVGSVSHFTWWNCDAPFPTINYKVKFVGFHFFPVSNALVKLTRKSVVTSNPWWNTTQGITASDGSVSGSVPFNETFEMNVYASPQCTNSTPVYTTTVGPFIQDTDGGSITINNSNINMQTVVITGTVVNCSNNPVVNGYAIVNVDNNKNYASINNGNLNASIIYCGSVPSSVIYINVFDTDSLIQSTTSKQINITGAGLYNAGQISACGTTTITKYVNYTTSFINQNDATGFGGNLNIVLKYDNISLSHNLYTNGLVTFSVPTNKKIIQQLYYNSYCRNNVRIDSTQIGAFNRDTVIAPRIINTKNPYEYYYTIQGKVLDCNNNPMQSGIATITLAGTNKLTNIINGNFSNTFMLCGSALGSNITIDIKDLINHKLKTPATTITINDTINDAGQITSCGLPINEYLTTTFLGNTYDCENLKLTIDSLNNTSQIGKTYNIGYPLSVNGNFLGSALGNFPYNLTIKDIVYGTIYSTDNINKVNVNITEYGAVGQYIAGVFSGNVKQQNSNNIQTIIGSFRIKRTQ